MTPTWKDFLREMFGKSAGAVWVGAFRNRDSELPSGLVGNPIVGRKLPLTAEFIGKYDRPEHECGIYFTVCTSKPGTTQRTGENVFQIPALNSDIDDPNHSLTREQVLERLDECGCPPSIVVNSGHGLQAYWLLSTASEDIDLIVTLRKKLQCITASDSVHDAPRIMRLPGTHNTKIKGEQLPVEIVHWHPERRYNVEELEAWVDHEGMIIPRKEESKPKSNGHDRGEARHVMLIATTATSPRIPKRSARR